MPGSPAFVREDSQVARVLSQGYARLRFPEPLEAEFRAEHRVNSLRWVRMSILVAVGTSAGFALIDPLIIKATNALPNIVRFGLQLPVLIVVLLSTYPRFYERWYQSAMQVGGPLFGIGTVLMASYAHPEHTALVGARILLVTFFFYFMSGLRLQQALRGNLIILAALVLAGVTSILPADVAAYLSFALLCANVIGVAGAYALEHANRTAFLERKLLVEVAELDGLTRLMNRHTFEARVRDACKQAMTREQNVSVLMIDVDHFKLYNDHYGHQAGDECLRRVATAVRSSLHCRADDLVARYGGEEIIAVLIGRSHNEVSSIAELVVADIASLNITHAASTSCAHVSVSVGAATQLPPHRATYDVIVKHADGALYAAKHQGRNRCVVVQARASVAA